MVGLITTAMSAKLGSGVHIRVRCVPIKKKKIMVRRVSKSLNLLGPESDFEESLECSEPQMALNKSAIRICRTYSCEIKITSHSLRA